MSKRQITIAVDAMGGENSPFKCLKGIEIFSSKKSNVNFKIYGDEISICFQQMVNFTSTTFTSIKV